MFVNPATLRLFGASAPEPVIGRSPFDVFHPDSHALIREQIGRMMAGESVSLAEERIVRLDGGVTDVEVNSTRLDESPGEVVQVIVARHLRTQAGRRRSPSERRAADAGIRRRAGGRLGLESRDRRRRVFSAMERNARLLRGRNRASRERLGASAPSRRRSTRQRVERDARARRRHLPG